MTLLAFINELKKRETIGFQLPNGTFVPPYFHVTEVGKVTRDFIDCGGTLRSNSVVNFQLWSAEDYDHRLHPEKLISIIEMAQKALAIGDLPIEVEFQGQTIETYGIATQGNHFYLPLWPPIVWPKTIAEFPRKNQNKAFQRSKIMPVPQGVVVVKS